MQQLQQRKLRDSKELMLHRTVHVCYALQNAAHTVDVPWSADSGFMWACWWYPSVKDEVSGPAEMPKTLGLWQNHISCPSLHHTPQTSLMLGLFTLNPSFWVSVEIISSSLLSYQSEIWFPTLSMHNQKAWFLGPLSEEMQSPVIFTHSYSCA